MGIVECERPVYAKQDRHTAEGGDLRLGPNPVEQLGYPHGSDEPDSRGPWLSTANDCRFGRRILTSLSEHLAWFFPGDQEIVLETYMSYYHAVVWQEQRLYPGILELIKRLKDKAYRTAILSDKRQDFGVPEFESSGLGGWIDRSVFFADGMSPKPDPAGLQDVMESLEVSPEECLFIGDSYRDIECAKRAGAWSGAALWASVEPELVITLQPEFLWNKVGDVAVTLNLE